MQGVHHQLQRRGSIKAAKDLARNLEHHGVGMGIHDLLAHMAHLGGQQHGSPVASRLERLGDGHGREVVVKRQRNGDVAHLRGKERGGEGRGAAQKDMRRLLLVFALEGLDHLLKELLCALEVVKQHMQEEDGLVVKVADDAVFGNLLAAVQASVDVDLCGDGHELDAHVVGVNGGRSDSVDALGKDPLPEPRANRCHSLTPRSPLSYIIMLRHKKCQKR